MSELWYRATGISICCTGCQGLQVIDVRAYTGEISQHLKIKTKVLLSFFCSLINTLIKTTQTELKNPHIVRDSTQKSSSHLSCVDLLPLAMLLLRQAASHLQDFSLDQVQDRPLWKHSSSHTQPSHFTTTDRTRWLRIPRKRKRRRRSSEEKCGLCCLHWPRSKMR